MQGIRHSGRLVVIPSPDGVSITPSPGRNFERNRWPK
jgi:hypothetical protein